MPPAATTTPAERGTRGQLIAAFAAVYVFWGSTYAGIRLAVDTIPPFTMAGLRHLLAGALLYPAVRRAAAAGPTRADWRAAVIVGARLLTGGNGLVS